MSRKQHLKIFEDQCSLQNKNILIWNKYSTNKNKKSLLDYIEKNSKNIRSKFLHYHNLVSKIKCKKKYISEFFNIDKKFSFWWITHFNEKNLFLSNSILTNLIKFIALKEIIHKQKVKEISFYFKNKNLKNVLKFYCENQNIKFNSYKQKKKLNLFKFLNLKEIIKFFFPKIVYSFFYFIFFLSYRLPFIKKTKIKNKNFDKIFFTYSSNLDLKKLRKKEYFSNYWGDKFSSKKLKNSLWINLYVKDKFISFRQKASLLERISKNENQYVLLESFLSLKVFLKILYEWFKMINYYLKIKKNLKLSLSQINIPIFEIIKNDLDESFLGASALINLYHFYLLKELSNEIENIKKGFYLCENLTWEKSMIFNLRNKINKIYGVQHAALRFWDLKFSKHPIASINKILSPDFYCCNGEDGSRKLKNFKINQKKIKNIEATRYKYLFDYNFLNKKSLNKKKILIIGDNSESSNLELADTINYLKSINKDKNFKFYLKNHPVMSMEHLLKIKFILTKKNLFELRKKFDFAIVANNTSAVVDLHLLGFGVLSLVEKNKLNLSPLKDSKDITFLYNKTNIYELLKKILNLKNKNKIINNNFFYYSKNYRMWNKILKK